MSEQAYLDLLAECLEHGESRGDRTGTGTLSLFGRQIRFDLSQGFPLLTTKRIHFKSVREELLWMLRGETNIRPLLEKGVTIWSDWPLKRYREMVEATISQEAFEQRVLTDAPFARRWGDLGPVYGRIWREGFNDEFGFIDQIRKAQNLIVTDPDSRRNVVTAWHPGLIDDMALPPCHYTFQFSVRADDRLDCMVTMRSCDIFLGAPFNIAQYALLTHLMASVTGKVSGDLIINFGDLHLYRNHINQAHEQLRRNPRPFPGLHLAKLKLKNVWEHTSDDFEVFNYDPHPAIKAEVAV